MELGGSKSAYGVFVIFISVIFSIGIFFLAIRPLFVNYQDLSKNEAQKEAELKRYTDKRMVLRKAKDNEESLRQLEEKILRIVPFKDDRPSTYWQFEKISEKSNVSTRSVMQSKYLEDSTVFEKFSEQSFTLNTIANYQTMLDFLHNIESSMRLFNIDRISISPNNNNLDLNINVNTFYGKEVQVEK